MKRFLFFITLFSCTCICATAQDSTAYKQDGDVIAQAPQPVSYSPWHSGLNIHLNASVFTQFGKHAHRGAGFSQSLSAIYLKPLSPKLTLSVGGYLSNINYAHTSYQNAGVSAMLAYRFDEHWEAFVYGQKNLSDNRHIPLRFYEITYMNDPLAGSFGDRIGATLRYNFNPSFSIQVSVEQRWMPNHFFPYPDTEFRNLGNRTPFQP